MVTSPAGRPFPPLPDAPVAGAAILWQEGIWRRPVRAGRTHGRRGGGGTGRRWPGQPPGLSCTRRAGAGPGPAGRGRDTWGRGHVWAGRRRGQDNVGRGPSGGRGRSEAGAVWGRDRVGAWSGPGRAGHVGGRGQDYVGRGQGQVERDQVGAWSGLGRAGAMGGGAGPGLCGRGHVGRAGWPWPTAPARQCPHRGAVAAAPGLGLTHQTTGSDVTGGGAENNRVCTRRGPGLPVALPGGPGTHLAARAGVTAGDAGVPGRRPGPDARALRGAAPGQACVSEPGTLRAPSRLGRRFPRTRVPLRGERSGRPQRRVGGHCRTGEPRQPG